MPTLIVKNLDEATFKKLKKWKEDLGLADREWSEFFKIITEPIKLNDLLMEKIGKNTAKKLLPLWAENFALNLPSIRDGKAINDLEGYGKGKAAIVVGAGPSLFIHKHLEMLAESSFDGVLLICDGVLKEALKAGVTPEKFPSYFVGTVDGNRQLIWRHYDDPLVDKYGSKIKALFTTMAAPNARERAEKAGIEIYWYNPVYDDWRRNESFTRLCGMMTSSEKRPKGIGCIRGGGNVGSALAVIAFSVLQCPIVDLIGIDNGYLDGTPIEKMSYYKAIVNSGGLDVAYRKYVKRIYNPYFKTYCLIDFVWESYREMWLHLASKMPGNVKLINSTEGGSLFGNNIYCIRFKDFLENYKDVKRLLSYRLDA